MLSQPCLFAGLTPPRLAGFDVVGRVPLRRSRTEGMLAVQAYASCRCPIGDTNPVDVNRLSGGLAISCECHMWMD